MSSGDKVDCLNCRHRRDAGYVDGGDRQAQAISSFRGGRGRTAAGAILPTEALAAITVYSGYGLLLEHGSAGPQAIALVWPGQLVPCALGATARDVKALTDVTFCRFELHRWCDLLAVPALANHVVQILARQLYETEAMLAAVRRLPARARVCRVLGDGYLQLLRRHLVSGPSFDLPLSRLELAQLVGLTGTHLRRILQDLEDHQVLSFRRGRVVLHSARQVFELGELEGRPPKDALLL
jgi:CRP-like cAMP-binding protein